MLGLHGKCIRLRRTIRWIYAANRCGHAFISVNLGRFSNLAGKTSQLATQFTLDSDDDQLTCAVHITWWCWYVRPPDHVMRELLDVRRPCYGRVKRAVPSRDQPASFATLARRASRVCARNTRHNQTTLTSREFNDGRTPARGM